MVDFAVGSAFDLAFSGIQVQVTVLSAAVSLLVQVVIVGFSFLLFTVIILALWGQLNR